MRVIFTQSRISQLNQILPYRLQLETKFSRESRVIVMLPGHKTETATQTVTQTTVMICSPLADKTSTAHIGTRKVHVWHTVRSNDFALCLREESFVFLFAVIGVRRSFWKVLRNV